MIVWRRWIFPILLLLVFGAIAAALVKIAFLSNAEATAVAPQTTIADPVTTVERGSVVSLLNLSGTIARDDDVVVRSTVEGTVTDLAIGSGATVTAGQRLLTIKQSDPVRNIDIVAPEAGVVGEVALVKGQPVSLGSEILKITPNRYHLVSKVEPVQLYRLLNAPTEGTVTITGGPAPFTCTGVTVKVTNEGSATVTCAVPVDQTVFAGLPATVDIAIGEANDVLIVPTTAVKGGSGTGSVWLDRGDGTPPQEKEVKLGLNDGSNVEILEGLAQGDSIRQFVPGVLAPEQENCFTDPSGQKFCEGGTNW